MKPLFQFFVPKIFFLLIVFTFGVNSQNCAIPRVVTFSDNGEDHFSGLTETALPGILLLKFPTRNILAAHCVPNSPTSFISVTINKNEIQLSLAISLKNYLDDSRKKTVDFKVEFECSDGRNKTVDFYVPFRDENTKVPHFSHSLYTGKLNFSGSPDQEVSTDNPVLVYDEDRDEVNALLCVAATVENAAVGIRADVSPIYVIPNPQSVRKNSIRIPDEYKWNISLYFYKDKAIHGAKSNVIITSPFKFTLTAWNRNPEIEEECGSEPGYLVESNFAYVELYIENIPTSTTAAPVTDPESTTMADKLPGCYLVHFTNFYYKSIITDLSQASKGLELPTVHPLPIFAWSSSGNKIEYELNGSKYLQILADSGKVSFIQDVNEEDVGQMENQMEIVEIRAMDTSDPDSSAWASLIVLFDLEFDDPGTSTMPPSCSTTTSEQEPECPICPTTQEPGPSTEPPDACPAPSCPTPEPCPTEPTTGPNPSTSGPIITTTTRRPTSTPTSSTKSTTEPTTTEPTTSEPTTTEPTTSEPTTTEPVEPTELPSTIPENPVTSDPGETETTSPPDEMTIPTIQPSTATTPMIPEPSEQPSTTSESPEISTTGPEKCSSCECGYKYKCIDAGLFPNPFACNSFYSCAGPGANGSLMKCATKHLVFCPGTFGTGDCLYPTECECELPKPPCCPYCPCDPQCVPTSSDSAVCRTGADIPDPYQCDLFHKCQDDDYGGFVDCTMSCPDDLVYCPEYQGCTWIDDCPTQCPISVCSTTRFWSRMPPNRTTTLSAGNSKQKHNPKNKFGKK